MGLPFDVIAVVFLVDLTCASDHYNFYPNLPAVSVRIFSQSARVLAAQFRSRPCLRTLSSPPTFQSHADCQKRCFPMTRHNASDCFPCCAGRVPNRSESGVALRPAVEQSNAVQLLREQNDREHVGLERKHFPWNTDRRFVGREYTRFARYNQI